MDAIDGLKIGEIRLRDGGRIARDRNIKTYLQSRSFADLASHAYTHAALRIYPLLFLAILDQLYHNVFFSLCCETYSGTGRIDYFSLFMS